MLNCCTLQCVHHNICEGFNWYMSLVNIVCNTPPHQCLPPAEHSSGRFKKHTICSNRSSGSRVLWASESRWVACMCIYLSGLLPSKPFWRSTQRWNLIQGVGEDARIDRSAIRLCREASWRTRSQVPIWRLGFFTVKRIKPSSSFSIVLRSSHTVAVNEADQIKYGGYDRDLCC